VLQTGAALANLAAESCTTAAGLPFVVNGSARLRALLTRNTDHHRAHAQAFNQALGTAGGAEQHAPDARYAETVRGRLAAMTDPAALADLLAELEDVNAQTCARFATLAESGSLRSLFVDIASVEAQHASELLVLRALLGGHAEPSAVPTAAGTAGIPHAVYPTGDSSAIDEGEVR
jgi:tRNA isopentenyl-2-thiomethyl-A-37 hydroxylase MiaE